MSKLYSARGMLFRYPDDWMVGEESSENEIAITARPIDDSTAFWSLTLLADRPDPREALASVLEAFEEEYDDLDVYTADEPVARREALGRDLEFVCLELTNSAFVRVFQTAEATVVLLYQATDYELDTHEEALKEITASLECDLGSSMNFA